MTSFNMPPGCNVSDLPGNTPADRALEAFHDAVWKQLGGKMAEEDIEAVAQWFWLQLGAAYADGYQSGQADAQLAAEYHKSKDAAP